jgi:hypothetical protein
MTSPRMSNHLIERLRSGATKSTDVGSHLNKYQSLCDEAADLIERLTTPAEGLETTAEERAQWAADARGTQASGDFDRLLRDHATLDTALELASRDVATLTARLAAADGLQEERWLAAQKRGDALWTLQDAAEKELTAERTAREALEAALREARGILAGTDYPSLPNDWTLAQVAEARMDDIQKYMDQVRHTCIRAEKAEAALTALREQHPEPEGVVEEPPRDNSITDAW